MAITYALYCKECYRKLKEEVLNSYAKARAHNSYFICTNCGFETDRGYAVQISSPIEPPKKTHVLNI